MPIMFQTDGQWWFVLRPETNPGDPDYIEDAYSFDSPLATILADVFQRFNGGTPCEYVVVDRGVKIGPDGWPADKEVP